jgi:long-chain acyl-CoA synthetase
MPEELEIKLGRLEYVVDVVCYEENGSITAEFYLDEEHFSDARSRLEEDIGIFNRTMPMQKNISGVKIRDIPFEKTTTMKIKRYLLKQG